MEKSKDELIQEIVFHCELFSDQEGEEYLISLSEKEVLNLYYQFLIPILKRFSSYTENRM